MKATIGRQTVRGERLWVVRRTLPDGSRPRKFFRDEKSAKEEATKLTRDADLLGRRWLSMSPRWQSEVIAVADEVAEAGLSMRAVWDGYRSGQHPAQASTITLSKAIQACVTERRNAGRRPAYIAALDYTLGRFARGREEMHVARITADDCRQWLAQSKAASVRASFQSRLSTLFSWCVTAGHLATNPVESLAKISIDQRAPVILTPAQVDSAIAWVAGHPDFRAYLVLGLFCGIRPDELLRLTWAAVDLGRGLVTIDAATSKVRRRRIVPIAPRALALMSPKSVSGTSVWGGSPITLRRRRRALAIHLGIEWQADLLRHTAASYLMARDKDAGKVADMLGNSPGVLLTRYRELVSPEDAARFWAT